MNEKISFLHSLGRTYVDIQKVRLGAHNRLIANQDALSENEIATLKLFEDSMKKVEANIVKKLKAITKEHLLWTLAANVKGLDDVGVLTLLGYIEIHKVTSAGKAKAYFGLTPNHGKSKGKNHNYNHEAKGRLFGVIVKGVIMAKDPFYYNYYRRMKEYYVTRKDWATRKDEPVWKAKIDNLAKRKIAFLLLSHATEIMRRSEGLDASAWTCHHNYIPPPMGQIN